MSHLDRIIVLIDMDCFYVQVEQRRNPDVRGKPCAVVQYNQWKGGGIIAVGYEARAKGVTRQMRGDDAKQKCPDIILFKVPTANGKADLTRYRDAGAEVIQVLLQFGGVVERASIDEAYIDLTDLVDEKITAAQNSTDDLPALPTLENTYVVGYPREARSDETDLRIEGLEEYMSKRDEDKQVVRLCIAAGIVEEMRLAIYEQTSFRCSAGVSHNKMLSKFACGINKPNKQTILPMDGVPKLFMKTKLGKIRNLGGKLGTSVTEKFGTEFIGQLTSITKSCLVSNFGNKTGHWLYDICRGIDHEPIKERHIVQSVGCSKLFSGADALNSRKKVKHWVQCLVTELVERLIKDKYKNNRVAKSLTIHVGFHVRKTVSRTCHIDQYEVEHVTRKCMATLEQLNENENSLSDAWKPVLTMLGISSKNFKQYSENYANVTGLLTLSKPETSPNKVHKTKQVNENSGNQRSLVNQKKAGTSSLEAFMRPVTVEMKHNAAMNCASPAKGKSETPLKPLGSPVKSSYFKTNEAGASKENFFTRLKTSREKKTKHPEANGTFPLKLECKATTDVVDLTKEVGANEPSDTPASKENDHVPITESEEKRKSNLDERCSAGYTDFTYLMSDVDQDVFQALPLHLQQEIAASSQRSSVSVQKGQDNENRSPTKGRKRQSESPSNQNSISKFLRPLKQSPAQVSLSRSPSTVTETKTKAKKSKAKVSTDINTTSAVPLGFFRARSQASAAIKSAVARRSDPIISSDKKAKRENSTGSLFSQSQRNPAKTTSTSLWSSALDTDPSYKCHECNTMVPISQVSSHSDYHARMTKEAELPKC